MRSLAEIGTHFSSTGFPGVGQKNRFQSYSIYHVSDIFEDCSRLRCFHTIFAPVYRLPFLRWINWLMIIHWTNRANRANRADWMDSHSFITWRHCVNIRLLTGQFVNQIKHDVSFYREGFWQRSRTWASSLNADYWRYSRIYRWGWWETLNNKRYLYNIINE